MNFYETRKEFLGLFTQSVQVKKKNGIFHKLKENKIFQEEKWNFKSSEFKFHILPRSKEKNDFIPSIFKMKEVRIFTSKLMDFGR